MKICKDCGLNKDESLFYGVQGECKDCTKLRVKKRELKKRLDPEWVEKERKRSRDKYHRLNYKDKHKSSERVNRTKSLAKHKKKFPEKYKAIIASQRVKVPSGFERHHWSYKHSDSKDIIPLSIRDHNQLHRFLQYDSDKFLYRTKAKVGDFIMDELLDTKEQHINYYLELKTSKLWE